ncbi:MAG TPA: proline dehydrogenase family protein [Streptosporangiaceae bacterium]|nr:proline dehydrogenase family protein [Streptosporangiaceae bacterium]
MLRRVLLAASASSRVHHLITTTPITRSVVKRFVAGETAAEALSVVQRLLADGLLVTLDYLGEYTTEPEHATAVTNEYIALVELLAANGLTSGGRAEVSVKPTAVGLGLVENGEKTAAENIARVCSAAQVAGTTVTVDMEDHTRVESTLRLVTEARAEFPDLGCVLQSYLRRTPGDCEALAGPGSRVRLCKGAYSAPDGVALAARSEVDRNYARCLRILLDGDGYPMLATHDPRLIAITHSRTATLGRDPSSFEYQMLYGIRPDEQRRLADEGAQVRVYVPYGNDWYGYLVRRLAERPANLMFFLRALRSRK